MGTILIQALANLAAVFAGLFLLWTAITRMPAHGRLAGAAAAGLVSAFATVAVALTVAATP